MIVVMDGTEKIGEVKLVNGVLRFDKNLEPLIARQRRHHKDDQEVYDTLVREVAGRVWCQEVEDK